MLPENKTGSRLNRGKALFTRADIQPNTDIIILSGRTHLAWYSTLQYKIVSGRYFWISVSGWISAHVNKA